jgi:hypothetical protein
MLGAAIQPLFIYFNTPILQHSGSMLSVIPVEVGVTWAKVSDFWVLKKKGAPCGGSL